MLLAGLAPLLHAEITGQWDFNNPANGLAVSTGKELEYLDGPNAPFQIQRANSLAPSDWQNAGTPTEGRTFAEPIDGTAAFCRVVSQ